MATVVLSGGVGAAVFDRLVKVMDPRILAYISNTGDDSKFYGLYVCPDIDTVIYTLADMVNPQTGWGWWMTAFKPLQSSKLWDAKPGSSWETGILPPISGAPCCCGRDKPFPR